MDGFGKVVPSLCTTSNPEIAVGSTESGWDAARVLETSSSESIWASLR